MALETVPLAKLRREQPIYTESLRTKSAEFSANDLFLKPAWYALNTRSRNEKVVNELLTRKKIEPFLPLRHIKRRWSDRIKEIEDPLFKGYLFVHAPLVRRVEILQSKGAVQFIGFGPIPSVVPEKEIEALRRFMAEDIEMDPFP